MKILAIEHDAADPPAHAGTIVTSWGHQLQVIRVGRGDEIPTVADADWLMTFGGGISLARDELPDWVQAEQNLITKYVNSGRRVLGICLGAQLVAAALGAKVHRNDHPEVGWHAVEPVKEDDSPIGDLFADSPVVFHWHQDTFDIPSGATHLAKSAATKHQGFAIGDRVVGLQFHLEANEKTVRTFLFASKLWRKQAPFVQSESQIIRGLETHLPHQQQVMEQLLRRMTRR